MKYLTLAADYHAISLREEHAGALDPGDLELPPDLAEDLVAWNQDYQRIIPMEEQQRATVSMTAVIDELDRRGIALAERLADVFGDGTKVRYYSEGRLRRLE